MFLRHDQRGTASFFACKLHSISECFFLEIADKTLCHSGLAAGIWRLCGCCLDQKSSSDWTALVGEYAGSCCRNRCLAGYRLPAAISDLFRAGTACFLSCLASHPNAASLETSSEFCLFPCSLCRLAGTVAASAHSHSHCENYVGLDATYYRTAIRSHAENQILLQALQACL